MSRPPARVDLRRLAALELAGEVGVSYERSAHVDEESFRDIGRHVSRSGHVSCDCHKALEFLQQALGEVEILKSLLPSVRIDQPAVECVGASRQVNYVGAR